MDTNTLKAHSVQGASTSVSVGNGLHIRDGMKTADWSRKSTFQQMYYRSVPSVEKNFAQIVLSTRTEKLPIVNK